MTMTEVIVSEFIEHYIQKTNDRGSSNKVKRKLNRENDNSKHLKCSKQDRQQSKRILQSLLRIADEFDKFIGDSSQREERFIELTTPLVPLLKGNGQKNQQQYSKAFKEIADELFSQDITWTRVVTFLVYSGELAAEVTKQSKSEDKISTMISQVKDSICRYFEEKIMQWIEQQDGGWLSVIAYEKEINANESDPSISNGHLSTEATENGVYGRCIKQVISLAAFAAVIGGIYMCSKLTVQ